MAKQEVTYSESTDNIVRPSKGLTTSMSLRTKNPNKKQKEKFDITENNNQDLREFIKKFNNSPYICYKIKQVHSEPTEAYFFLTK